jgi:DNA polymerase
MSNAKKLELIANKIAQCKKCGLCENRTKTVPGIGNPKARVVFIGEGPGRDEDQSGEPFVGRAGSLLNNIIEACEWKREQIYITNIVKCRPPNNRNPEEEEAAACRAFLDLQLKVINPEYIVCLGAVASKYIIAGQDEYASLNSLRLVQNRNGLYKYEKDPVDAKVLCTFHPAYLLRNPKMKKESWQDMLILISEMERDHDTNEL